MIVAAWFTLIALIILAGFTLVGLTFWHWHKEAKLAKLAKANEAAASVPKG